MNTNATTSLNSGTLAHTNDIHGLKPPIDIPNAWLWFWSVLVVLALAAACFAIWRYSRKKAAVPPPIPVIPPHMRARKRLEQALALISQPKPFCILVSDTIRVYLEERFRFHAPERTTEEFLHELQASNLLLPDQKSSLGDFLALCDMVKFARYEPGPTELQALHQSAVRLIDETEPQPVALEKVLAAPSKA